MTSFTGANNAMGLNCRGLRALRSACSQVKDRHVSFRRMYGSRTRSMAEASEFDKK